MKTRVLIADDHQITRKGLSALIAEDPAFDVVAETGDGLGTIEAALALRPEVIVMDISMPDVSGIEATRAILAQHPTCRILALSIHTGKFYVTEMLSSGAAGYLPKDCDLEEVVRAIHAVVEGKTYISPSLANMVIRDYIRFHHSGKEDLPRLSHRESEVLRLLAGGMSTKEIAAELTISRKTVETHRARIMNKLDLHSVAELARYAEREGLLAPRRREFPDTD